MKQARRPSDPGRLHLAPTTPVAHKASVAGIICLVLGLGGLTVPGNSPVIDFFVGLFILLAPVCTLVAVVAQSRAKEAARIDALPEERKQAELLNAKVKPVISAILLATILVSGVAGKVLVAVGGIVVLLAWIAWISDDPDSSA